MSSIPAWARIYQGVRAVGISVSTTNNQKNRSLIREVMRNTELAIHSKNEFFIYEPE